jgi:hypothetical protein
MKMTVFWDVAPCSLVKFTDVSEMLAASIIRAIQGSSEAPREPALMQQYSPGDNFAAIF